MTETPPTVGDFREALLANVIGYGALAFEAETKGRLVFHLNIGLVVNAYKAHRFFAALEQHVPEEVLTPLLADVWDVLEDGALPEYAWDDAVAAGFDPSEWGEKTVAWARRLNASETEAGRG